MRGRKYVKAMMKAIDEARESGPFPGDEKTTRANGLRVIRRFERVNNFKFDPFDQVHLRMVSGNGHHEAFFRAAHRLFK